MAQRRTIRSEHGILPAALAALVFMGLWTSPSALAQTELPNPLFNPSQSDNYGHEVALGVGSAGDNIAFISDYANNAVHWFSDGGGNWTNQVTFTGDGSSQRFGEELALRSGVSAWNDGWAVAIADSLDTTTGTASGAVWVASSTMSSQFFTLGRGSSGDRFGAGVAFSGNDLIVSASGDDTNSTNAGALFVYSPTFSGGSLQWGSPTLIDTSALPGENLGRIVVANENWVFATIDDNVNGGNEVAVIERAGGSFQVYGPQPFIPITTGFFGGGIFALDVEGDLLTVANTDGSGLGVYREYRWHAPTARWQHVTTTDFTGFPTWLATEGELRIGVGDVSVAGVCHNVPLRTWQRLGGKWTSTAHDPSPDAVGAGSVDNRGRRFVMGSVGGTFCQFMGLRQGTAYYFDFTSDRDVDGTDDAAQIASDPCADRNANGVVDSTEGLINGWINENGGSYTEVFDTGTSTWNWSDGSPDGKLIEMLHEGSTAATVTLGDTSSAHGVLGLTVAGNDSADAELQLRLAPNTQIDSSSASTCIADVIIEADGRITVDDAGLTAPRLEVRSDGVLEIAGANGHADLVTLADLLPGSRVEMRGGALNAASVFVGEDGGAPETGGEIIGFGTIPGLVLEVRDSGLLHANQSGGGATLTVQGISFKHEGRIDVGELDTLRVETSDLLFAGKTVVENAGTFDLAYSSFFSLPAEHTGDAELRGGAIRVLDSAPAVLLNKTTGKIHGDGQILGELRNEGRIETTVAGGLEALDLTDQTGGILVEGPGQFTSSAMVNEGIVQVTGGGKLFTATGDYENYETTYLEGTNSAVGVAGDSLNTTSVNDTGQVCILNGATWDGSGTFTNDVGAQLELDTGTLNATSFTNNGVVLFSGTNSVNTNPTTGTVTNNGDMFFTGGTTSILGSPGGWTNTGFVCVSSLNAFYNGTLLQIVDASIAWSCTTSPPPSGCSSAPLGADDQPSRLTLLGDFVAEASTSMDLSDGILTLAGDFDVAIDDTERRLLHRGTIETIGTSQELEVLARDFGPNPTRSGRFKGQIGTLRIGPAPTTVKLVDNHSNDGGNEVLYARDLILESGTTLDLGGRTLYYETIQQAADAMVTDSVGGGQLVQSQPPFAAPPGVGQGKGGKK